MDGMQVNQNRRLWKCILFGLLTAGIYTIWFQWTMINDLNTVCGHVEGSQEDRSPHYIVLVLFSLITVGIYMLVWYYRQGNRMQRAGREYGLEIDETGSTYLKWILLGVLLLGIGPIVALYLFICNMNKLAEAYNIKTELERSGADYPSENSLQNTAAEESVPEKVQPTIEPVFFIPETADVIDEELTSDQDEGNIRCLKGGYEGAVFRLKSGEQLRVGRSTHTNQLILQDADISRSHCVIEYEDNLYYVTDMSSYGSTFLNGTMQLRKGVRTPCPLGSVLTLGNGSNQFILQ